MPQQAGAELRAQERRPRAVQEARGKVIDAGAPAAIPPASSLYIPQQLPPAPPTAPTLVVELDSKGAPSIDGRALSMGSLDQRLRDAARRDPSTRVVLSVLVSTRFDKVIVVVDRVRASGFADVTFSVR